MKRAKETATWIISAGNKEVVRFLLDKGADVNAQGGQYGNALYAASREGHEEIAQQLLDRGAHIEAQGGQYGDARLSASERDPTLLVSRTTGERQPSFDVQAGTLNDLLKQAPPSTNGVCVCYLKWNLKECIALDLYGECALGDVLTITGDAFAAFGTTCKDWVLKTWEHVGIKVLDATSEAIANEGEFLSEFVSISLNGETGIDECAEVTIMHTDIEVLVAVVETLTWLAATFRPSVENCISYSSAKATLTGKGIEISLERLTEAEDNLSTCCWHRVLGSAIIAKGFWKVSNEPGLQLPFPLMLDLTGMMYRTDISKTLNDGDASGQAVAPFAQRSTNVLITCDESSSSTEEFGIFFSGVHSVLYPTNRDDIRKTIKWHYATSDAAMTPPQDGTWLRLRETDLQGMVHILGFTPEVVVLLGTKDRSRQHCTMQASSARKEKDSWSFDWDGITAQAGFSGSGLSLPFKFVRRKAQKATPSAKPTYDQVIHHTVRDPVIIFDTAQDQGTAWLVPKLSLILDLTLFQIEKKGWFRDLDDDLKTALFAKPHWNGGHAAREVLDNYARANTTLALSSDDGQAIAVKDLVKEIFAAMTARAQLDQLYPSSQTTLSRCALLTGWDLLELTNPIRFSKRLQVDLNKGDRNRSTPTWLQFANQVSVFLCDNIGEIMKSVQPPCPASHHDKKNLIANIHVLGGLMTSCMSCRGFHVGTDKKWIWKFPRDGCFALCSHVPGHTRTREGNCFRDRMQLMLSEDHACEAREVTTSLPKELPKEGAVVFGSKMLRVS